MKSQYVSGEPILIKCELLNTSSEPLQLDLGYDRIGSFTFGLEGQPAQANTKISRGGLTRGPRLLLKPAQRYEDIMLLTEWIPIPPGKQTVVGRLNSENKVVSSFTVNIVKGEPHALTDALIVTLKLVSSTPSPAIRFALEKEIVKACRESDELRNVLTSIDAQKKVELDAVLVNRILKQAETSGVAFD